MNAIQIIDYAEEYNQSKFTLMKLLAVQGYACKKCHRLLAVGAKCPNAHR